MNSVVPFVRGGAEEFADNLCARLNAACGVRAEVLRVPFSTEPFERLVEEIFFHRSLELPNVDRVIALKFPAYFIPHPRKVLWLSHQSWPADHLCVRGKSARPETLREERVCELIRQGDEETFSKCHKIFTDSEVTRERLKRYLGVEADALMPPLNNPEVFDDCGDRGYIFAGGCLKPANRQRLLLEAMGMTRSASKLIVAGPLDTPDYGEQLRAVAKELKLEDRVVLDLGSHSLAKIADYVNHARACVYLPFAEDFVGYTVMQAASASKPVITATDAGGALEVVLHGQTGFVARPDAKSLAAAIDALAWRPDYARQLGRAARHRWDSFEVTWSHTIKKLLA